MNRSEEIKEQFFEQLQRQEAELQKRVSYYRERLEREQNEVAEAKKRLPLLQKSLPLKMVLLEKVTAELQQLQNEVAICENLANDEGSFSMVEATKKELARAEYQASIFMKNKLESITR